MSSPKLDARTADDVLKQARALARNVYLSGLWKVPDDPSDPAYQADPAHQLLRVFSRLMEILFERLNKVPDKNFLAFLDLVGVELAPGAPATVPVTFLTSVKAPEGGPIPAGTQVATTQTDQTDTQIFETRQAIYATAAKLSALVNVLPALDWYSIIPPPELPPKPAEPGSKPSEWVALSGPPSSKPNEPPEWLANIPHILYLGSADLFGRKETLDVTLELSIDSGDASLLSSTNLVWKKFDKDIKDWVNINVTYPQALPGKVTVVLGSFGNSAKTSVAGQEEFWVACHFIGAFTLGLPPLRLSAINGGLAPAGNATSATEPPEKAFADAQLVDLSRPWKPFGERPSYGNALYLMDSRAFAPEVDSVTVNVTLKPYTNAILQSIFASIVANTTVTTKIAWQYLAVGGDWKPLTVFEHTFSVAPGNPPVISAPTIKRDGATNMTEDGTFFGKAIGDINASFTFQLPSNMATGKVNDKEGLWIRALLMSDDPYGKDAFIASANPLKVVGSTLIPPVVENLSLSFTYKNNPQPVTRIVTKNNFRLEDHGQLKPPSTPSLQPFLSPLEYTLPGSTAPAFGGNNALYLGFDRTFGDAFISIYFKLRETFPTVTTPTEKGQPLLAWEYLASETAGTNWKPLDVQDETASLTNSGTVSFLGTEDIVPIELFGDAPPTLGRSLFWFRIRLASGFYNYPPTLQGIYLNTVLADNRVSFRAEYVVGSGSGNHGQSLLLLKTPVLTGALWVREPAPPSKSELDVLVAEFKAAAAANPLLGELPVTAPDDVFDGSRTSEAWVRWRRVPNFFGSNPRSRHYTLNAVSGELRLGDGEKGMLAPVIKDNLVLRDYRTGGGESAMVAAVLLAVKELKSSLPYVEKVFNVEGATGGSNPWTIDDLFVFGPQFIKNKGRAVSSEDFEWMVLERFSQVARVKCLSTRAPGGNGLEFKPGAVTLIVVPKGRERKPQPSSALLLQINDFLSEQCLGNIISDVHVLGPGFKEIAVHARLHARNTRESSEIERRATKMLEDFFHPLTGGEDGRGWGFGRDVQISEVYATLQRVAGVDFVAAVEFIGASGASVLEIDENSLVFSGSHHIEMI